MPDTIAATPDDGAAVKVGSNGRTFVSIGWSTLLVRHGSDDPDRVEAMIARDPAAARKRSKPRTRA
ncbi:hypothetical protein [Sphingomonas sp. 10B4]|uniref:hypothetical protein n=1 Tax=Sphingomonas sp. 10B4 TaxID=3048575 RepID=UPI002AB5454A|nr:hypothetical protein [Sphingomonas sp. 10B4]MDY7525199.1 hypothetical protein [Sphingomonas sp. 10B4]